MSEVPLEPSVNPWSTVIEPASSWIPSAPSIGAVVWFEPLPAGLTAATPPQASLWVCVVV